MRILKHTLRCDAGRVALIALVSLAVGGSASAGTVYSWKTDDGTFAYTDDRKRIPARYRTQASARSMEQLASYKRFTQSSIEQASDYSARLNARRDRLRAGGAIAMAAPGRDGGTTSETFLVRTSGNRDGTATQVGVPIDDTHEPIISDNFRVRADSAIGPGGSIATRHITVVRQGDRLISVTRPQTNQGPLVSPRESEALK